MKNICKYSFLFLLTFSIQFHLVAQNETFTLDDINRLVNISSLQISPNGKSALWMASRRNLEMNRYDRELVLLDIVSKNKKVIAQDIKGISSPSWTKDGSSISMIARGDDGRQVYNFNISTEEVLQITKSENGISRYTWSPDGKQIAYFSKDKKAEKTGANKFNDSYEVGSDDYLKKAPTTNTSVWLSNADGSNPQKITPDGFTVATGLTTSALAWSPNGKMITFTSYPSASSGDSDLGRNFIYQLDSKELKPATKNTQQESSPRFSPDNLSLVYRYPRDGFPANLTDWNQVDLATGKINNITLTLNRNTSDIQWLGSVSILLRGIDKWGNTIFKIKDSEITTLNFGDLASISRWSLAKDGSMVFTGVKKNYPVEVYYKSSLEAEPIPLTSYNKFVKNIKLGKQEGIEWTSSDGLSPTGILTYPPHFDPTKKYPLVLKIHGGPSASSLLGFSPLSQAMAAKGWIVFEPNYRGSTNQGNKFQATIAKDPSEGPGHDVITGVNMLKEKPYVADDKICVSGWSYGGWMTSWLIGRYPEVWNSAVAGAAPVDVTDMYSLNDLNRMKRHSMVESPYIGDNMEWAFKNSPISNFSKIIAPTLIMSKTGDTRVTITGSYKLYGALRDNNIPVQFIAYPGPGHFPRDPVRSMDVYTRWISWLEKNINGESIIRNEKP